MPAGVSSITINTLGGGGGYGGDSPVGSGVGGVGGIAPGHPLVRYVPGSDSLNGDGGLAAREPDEGSRDPAGLIDRLPA